MYGNIKAAIQAWIVAKVPNVNPQWVYNYEPTLPSGFPAISITAWSGEGVFADTARNRRDYTFRIRVYQERVTVGTQGNLSPESEAERILTAFVDNIIGAFDSNTRDGNNNGAYNLGGAVPNLVFVHVIPQQWGYVNAPNMNMRTADIMLKATVVQ